MRVKYAVFILKYTNKRVRERDIYTKTKKKGENFKTTVCAGNILL